VGGFFDAASALPVVFDLTHPVETGTPTYPGDPPVTVTPHATHEADGYRVSAVSFGSHAGTHVDAPAHTEPDGRTLDTFPVSAFAFDGLRVDCRDLAARDPISPDRVPDAEADADCVVFWTGWDRHWGTDRYGDHPHLTPATARACADRGYAVALDTPSPDPTPTGNARDGDPDGLPAHHALLGSDLPIVENLTGLGAVPDRFGLQAFPLALASDGAPVRAVGVPR
jgi:kynurenine formamidase